MQELIRGRLVIYLLITRKLRVVFQIQLTRNSYLIKVVANLVFVSRGQVLQFGLLARRLLPNQCAGVLPCSPTLTVVASQPSIERPIIHIRKDLLLDRTFRNVDDLTTRTLPYGMLERGVMDSRPAPDECGCSGDG